MQEQHSFEYAVIRVVPKVEREEFMNVGVILYCQSLSYLDALFTLNEERLFALSPGLEMDEIKKHLSAFCNICKGGPEAGPDRKAGYGFPISLAHGNAKYSTPMFQSASGTQFGSCSDPERPAQKTGAGRINSIPGLSESL